MTLYRFEAVTYSGTVKKGTLEAENPKALRQQLFQQQLVPISIKSVSDKPLKGWIGKILAYRRQHLTGPELTMLTRQLALLIQSGLPLDESLLILAEEHNKRNVRKLISEISQEIRSGIPLSQAIIKYSNNFDTFYQGIISAAEQSGKMGIVLQQLAAFLEARESFRQKTVYALIYPLILLSVSISVIIFLMTYVIPQISKVFESSHQTLPIITLIIINCSQFLIDWGLLTFIGLVGVIGAARLFLKNENVRFKFDRLCLNTPQIGSLILAFETARFAGTLSMLLEANVPILLAMENARKTLSNTVLKVAIHKACARLKEGSTLTRSLGSQAVFSPILIHLIRSGEASGKLSNMLKYAGENAALEAEQKTKIFNQILEPLLILFMGMIVLFVVLGVMQPILEMNQGIR